MAPALTPDAQAVVAYWATAFGKRPPKLNPKQQAKLEQFVGRYGTDRLKESCGWAAEKGLVEFDKALNACRSKYERDHAAPVLPPPGKEYTNGVTSQPAPADDRFAAFRKFG